MRIARTMGAALILLAAAGHVGAQPANDNCGGALPVVDGDNTVNNVNATQDTQVPCATGGPANSGADVWYAYTAAATGLRNLELTSFVRTTGAANGNGILSIYDACGGTLLACNDNGGIGPHAKIYHFPVTAGTTYYVRFSNRGGVTSGLMGTATLNIAAPPAPAALDDCALATPVAGQMTVPFTTVGLTNYDRQPWDCKNFIRDGWFAWTPSATGIGVVDACGAVGTGNLTLGVYRACGDVPLICYNTPAGFADPVGAACGPKICFDVVAGQTYLVRYGLLVESVVDPVASGDMHFSVRSPSEGITIPGGAIGEPGNCEDAPSADLNGGCNVTPNAFTSINLCELRMGTASARLQPIISNQNIPGSFPDMLSVDYDWYQFTLDTDQAVSVTGESEFFRQAAIFFGCPPTQIAAQATGTPNCTGVYTINLTTSVLVPGTYYFRISPVSDNVSNHSGVFDSDCSANNRYWFQITGSTPCPPTCPADFNDSGALSVQDIFDFLAAYFSNDPRADFNNSGGISVQDIFDFLAAYFNGCP